MEVRIGVIYSAKELAIDIDSSADEVRTAVENAIGQPAGMLWLTDTKGRRVGIPSDKLAYVEVEQEDGSKRVGFGIG